MAVTASNLSSISSLHPAAGGRSVLIVGNFLSKSGATRGVCEDLAERLPAYGWRVNTTSHHAGRVRRLSDMLSTAWRTRHNYGFAQVDVYSGSAFYWAAAVCGLLRTLHKPYILTLHGGNLPAFSRRRQGMVRSLLRSAAAVTAPSRYLAEEMSQFRSDIQVLPNAIDLTNYPFRHLTAAQPRLIWLRAFHQIYEPSLPIRALARLQEQFPDIRLVMVGPDKGDGSLDEARALAKQLGVHQRIQFVGRVPKEDIGQWMNTGDIFLNTSSVDNCPVTVLEAMACGACVVTSQVGGIPYLCAQGVDAMLVPPGDADAIAASVTQILRRPELASALSRNGRYRVEQLDWAAILPRWGALLRLVAGQCS